MEKQKLKKRLVIVGGGYAGTYAAMSLEHDFLVTLIDMKEYFEFTPSKLRLLVEPTHAKRVQIQYRHFLKKTLVVCDHVKEIIPGYVITDNNNIAYDYLIICTGSRNAEPAFEPLVPASPAGTEFYERNKKANLVSARSQFFERYNRVVKQSQSILIIGGGTVGIEFPEK